MNPFLEKYIALKKQYLEQDGNSSSVVALYDLADELAKSEDLEAKKVLVDLYEQLGLYTSAYSLFTEILDKPDRKQIKETEPFTRNESESWRSFCPSSSSKKRGEEV